MAWACGCYSIWTRRTSAGCRHSARSSKHSRSGLVPDDTLRPRGRQAADRTGQAARNSRAPLGCQKLTSVTPGRSARNRDQLSSVTPTYARTPLLCTGSRPGLQESRHRLATCKSSTCAREDHGRPPARTADERDPVRVRQSGSHGRRTDISCSIFELLISAVQRPSHDPSMLRLPDRFK